MDQLHYVKRAEITWKCTPCTGVNYMSYSAPHTPSKPFVRFASLSLIATIVDVTFKITNRVAAPTPRKGCYRDTLQQLPP